HAVRPPEGGDPRRRPHPLASLLQAIRLTGAHAKVRRRDFVYCAGWEDRTPFAALRTRLQADPGWQVHVLPTGHDAMHEDPEAVAALLLDERIADAAGSTGGYRGRRSAPTGTRRGIPAGATALSAT
ncbi:MAG: alpha/beta fold hydrolase, partial [Actinomycetes bacterium]